ncbi:MAG: hypothetical protein CMP33_03295 [Rickettsiales bacterium]|nr:hypothetical protein [Rickettsiales bacterium]|tara:strand:+ start:28037 stop:28678 length:642 start_codon:yes stop_codon:yes gene_type:complete
MKVHEIIYESTKTPLKEKPASGLGNVARKIGAKVLAKVGAKNTAAGMAGKVDAADKANALFTDFRAYLGQVGEKYGNAVDSASLRDFLTTKKMPTQNVPQQGVLTKKQVDQAIMKAVQDSYRGKGGVPNQPAGQKGAPAKGQAQGQAAGNVGGGAPAQQPAAQGTGSAQTPAGKAPPTKNGSTVGSAKSIPPSIQKQLDQMSAGEKKQLAGLI